MSNTSNDPQASPVGRKVFCVMAAAMLGVGAALLAVPGWFAVDHGTGALIGSAFLLVGVVDLIILKNWDKIFAPRSETGGSSSDE